jgi:hypothetical protein
MRIDMRFWLTLLILVAGCAKKPAKSAADEAPKYKPIVEKTTPEGLILQEVDIDADHHPDTFNYFRERSGAPRLLLRKEVDTNRDGKIDQITYYNDEAKIEREEVDGDFDGRFDWVEHWQAEIQVDGTAGRWRRMMAEADSDHDGVMDTFTYYDGPAGQVTRKELDQDNDGRVDFWERFDDKGVVTKTGRDTDGDGRMDERNE